jgi:hypothetical protein
MKLTKAFLSLPARSISLGVLAFSLCAPGATPVEQAAVPPWTTLPVRFVRTVDAKNARPGDRVVAKTLQEVVLPDGRRLSRGSLVLGHVVQAQPFHPDSSTGASQQPSMISIHFDRVVTGNLTAPVNVSVRAIADWMESDDASKPHYLDETDALGTRDLIGGGEFSPLDKVILDHDVAVAQQRRNGVFARLQGAEDNTSTANLPCEATDSEQSLAIFSPSACGVYGFEDISMPHPGRRGSGTFTLESPDQSVTLYAGTTALLEETAAR